MKLFLKRLLIENWPRKTISIIIAIVIWMTVNHTLTATKTISNIPVRIVNLPPNKTIEGINNDGLLSKKVTLSLTGRRSFLGELTPSDLEVVIDATAKPDEWIASITKKNLVSLTPDLDVSKGISDVSHQRFIIRLTKLMTEKIPILITQPIGEAPHGYQFLDIWPYRLSLTVSGPEEVVKQLKAQGQKLTFNLNNISKSELDAVASKVATSKGDEISFFVPDAWKQIIFPTISDLPLEIDDPQAKLLRIDFVRSDLIPIDRPIPVTLYFPQELSARFNPRNTHLDTGPFIEDVHGIKVIQKPLLAKGVSHLFVQIVRSMIQFSITVSPSSQGKSLDWSVLFVNPRTLEDQYVTTLMTDSSDLEIHDMLPSLREEYLRNRFRNYMNRFQLYKPDDTKFEPIIRLENGNVVVLEKDAS